MLVDSTEKLPEQKRVKNILTFLKKIPDSYLESGFFFYRTHRNTSFQLPTVPQKIIRRESCKKLNDHFLSEKKKNPPS